MTILGLGSDKMKKSGLLTFLAAVIPGVGYMYLGLVKRGLQVLIIYILIEPVFRLLGMRELSTVVQIPFWCYTFFDTYNLAGRIRRGETIPDSNFIFTVTERGTLNFDNRRITKTAAWLLIGLGSLAFIHNLLRDNTLYKMILDFSRSYFIPVILIAGGIYILFGDRD